MITLWTRRVAPCREHRTRRSLSPAHPGILLSLVALLLGGGASPATADVVRVVVDRRETLLDGRPWGAAGAYEKLVGRIFFAFDPEDPANARIVDLGRAPVNAQGQVEAWANFMVLQPSEPSRRSGVAWLEVSNRGGKATLRYFQGAEEGGWDPSTEAQLGDGLLMRRGWTLIWVGWQWDVPEEEGALRLNVPAVREADAEGWVRADWTVDVPADTLDLGHRGHTAYAPVRRDHPGHVLTVRDGRSAPRDTVPRESWRFVAGPDARLTRIVLEGGFEAGRIYELVYRGGSPRVAGLGLAVVRDVMSYAKYGLDSPFPARVGLAFGVSQTGRFLRHFLWEGFNVDAGGRKVFDGMIVHSAGAGRGSFNHRFAQPSRDAHRYSAFLYPTDLYPFAGRPVADPVTGREEGLLDRTPPDLRPRVMYTNTGYEYWGRAASLLHAGPEGRQDVEPLDGERIYHLAGGQHFVGAFPGGAPPPPGELDAPPVLRGNPLDFLPSLRALAVALEAWVVDDRPPPPSAHPSLAAGTLVPPAGVAWPRVPGLATPTVVHEAVRADYGPRFATEGIVTRQPPEVGPAYTSLVSQVDGLGNEMAGVRMVELRVPVATYLPWNLRGEDVPGPPGELSDFVGTFVPLPRTEAEREGWDDPRPSLEALYGSRTLYMRRVVEAVAELTRARLLLPEDAGAVSSRAARLWDWLMGSAGESGEG